MATDYVVRFTGQDNLSGTIKQLKNNLQEVGTTTTKLDQIKDKFNKIEASTAPLKKKLRDIKILMADMNLNGLSNTDLFNQMAQSAGNYADAMADASAATNVFANDNFKLEAMAQGLTAIAGAASIATGIMGVFGTENQKVAQAIMKVQSVLAILNGVQAVANVLNKDSALMLRLKQIRMAANTASTTANTAATTANTIATTANTTATTANTVAQNAWNVAKAVAKALLGDWTGLILVGAVALGAYALATDKSTEKTEQQTTAVKAQNDAVERQRTLLKNYAEATGNSLGAMVAAFKKLQYQWSQMADTAEKNKWIKDNTDEFKKLGLSIKGINDAEDVFVKNSQKMLKAFELRAKAAAAEEIYTEMYKDYLKSQMSYTNYFKKGDDPTNLMLNGVSAYGQFIEWIEKNNLNPDHPNELWKGYVDISRYSAGTVYELTNEGAKLFNQYLQSVGAVGTAEKEQLKQAENLFKQTQQELNDGLKQLGFVDSNLTAPSTPSTPTKKEDNKPDYQAGSLAAEEAKLQDLQKQLKNTKFETQEAMDAAIQAVAVQAAKVKQMKVQLGLEVAVDLSDDTITGLANQINAIEDRLKNEVLSEDERKQLVLERDIKVKAKTTLEIQSGFKDADPVLTRIEQQREAYQRAMEQISQMQQDYQLHIITKDDATEQLKAINQELEKLGLKPIELYIDTTGIKTAEEAIESFKEKMDSVGSVVNDLGSAFSSLSDAVGENGDGMLAMAGKTMQAIAQIIPQIVALIGAKEGEALASGTASAAGLPFPANLAAIASIIATITALFAGFAGSFADGGIISGNSFHGDKMIARVNAGEMILSKTQQANLFRALNNGGVGKGGQVEFKISGSTLTGVLKNYNNKMGKVK